MKKYNILLVEDEITLSKIMKYDFESSGFDVTLVHDGEKAYEMLKKNSFDALLVDWMIPKLSGVELIKRIRDEGMNIFVVMITAKNTEIDLLDGLTAGADLYIKKPFSNRELVLQLKGMLSRFAAPNQKKKIESEDIMLDLSTMKAFIHDKEVYLSKMEFNLLKLLMTQISKVYTRDELLNLLWGQEFDGISRVVDSHIHNLKQKIKPSAFEIRSSRGIGYALVPKK